MTKERKPKREFDPFENFNSYDPPGWGPMLYTGDKAREDGLTGGRPLKKPSNKYIKQRFAAALKKYDGDYAKARIATVKLLADTRNASKVAARLWVTEAGFPSRK